MLYFFSIINQVFFFAFKGYDPKSYLHVTIIFQSNKSCKQFYTHIELTT